MDGITRWAAFPVFPYGVTKGREPLASVSIKPLSWLTGRHNLLRGVRRPGWLGRLTPVGPTVVTAAEAADCACFPGRDDCETRLLATAAAGVTGATELDGRVDTEDLRTAAAALPPGADFCPLESARVPLWRPPAGRAGEDAAGDASDRAAPGLGWRVPSWRPAEEGLLGMDSLRLALPTSTRVSAATAAVLLP